MKHGLMELYWHFFKGGDRSEALADAEEELSLTLDKEQRRLFLRVRDLRNKQVDDETFRAFEIGFKLASTLACDLAQQPHLFCGEDHLALDSKVSK